MTEVTKSNMTLDQSSKAIVKLIASAASAYGKGRLAVQDAAVAIVRHASIFGDCDKASQLVRILNPKDRPTLIKWFMAVSPIGVKLDKDDPNKDKARFIKADSKAYNKFNLDMAAAVNWWELPSEEKPEAPKLGLEDFYDDIEKALKKHLTEATLAKFDASVTQDIINAVRDIRADIATYRLTASAAARANRVAPAVKGGMPGAAQIAA